MQAGRCLHRPSVDQRLAADHGVAAEGVSAFPQAVTQQMLANFVGGGAAISVLAREAGATLEVVDVGTLAQAPAAGVIQAQVARGTANFCLQPAMSAAQAHAALDAAAAAVARARAGGADVFIGGEMGIANTTTAAALACAVDCWRALAGAGTESIAPAWRVRPTIDRAGAQTGGGVF
jgi:nicotinate-nucleotide--dimethylbenzimidazole phosphoribosyltransferase